MSNANITFKDNRVQMKDALNDKSLAFLLEASNSIISQTQRNTPVGPNKGQLKRSFGLGDGDSYIDEDKLIAYIGSCLEYSIWVELGTGEYALKGNGRKGYWVFVDDGRVVKDKNSVPKEYTLGEAKKVMAYLRSKGLNAYYTNGRKPVRMLYKAYQSKEKSIERQAKMIFKEMNNV